MAFSSLARSVGAAEPTSNQPAAEGRETRIHEKSPPNFHQVCPASCALQAGNHHHGVGARDATGATRITDSSRDLGRFHRRRSSCAPVPEGGATVKVGDPASLNALIASGDKDSATARYERAPPYEKSPYVFIGVGSESDVSMCIRTSLSPPQTRMLITRI